MNVDSLKTKNVPWASINHRKVQSFKNLDMKNHFPGLTCEKQKYVKSIKKNSFPKQPNFFRLQTSRSDQISLCIVAGLLWFQGRSIFYLKKQL